MVCSTGLASVDLVYLTFGTLLFGLPKLSKFYMVKVLPYIEPIGLPLAHIGRIGSVFVTMSVTIERYYAIVHPLKHFTKKRYLLLISILATVVYNIPRFFEYQLIQVKTCATRNSNSVNRRSKQLEKGGKIFLASHQSSRNKAEVIRILIGD